LNIQHAARSELRESYRLGGGSTRHLIAQVATALETFWIESGGIGLHAYLSSGWTQKVFILQGQSARTGRQPASL
jgi:hypothetical protein